MSGFKGTPGPWVVVDEHPDRAVLDIHSCDGDTFVSVYTVDKFADHNANLIAAAPELLDLVQRANGKNGCHTVAWQEKAKEVLAKALGQ